MAGFIRALDAVVMRVMDGLMSIPPILLAIALMALTRASVQNVVVAITIAEFPRVSRLVRGVVLSLREQPYVEAAVASGTRVPVRFFSHVTLELCQFQIEPIVGLLENVVDALAVIRLVGKIAWHDRVILGGGGAVWMGQTNIDRRNPVL